MKKKLLIFIAMLILIFTVSCAQQPIKGEQSSIFETGDIKRVKVTSNKANIRSGCSNNTPVIQTSTKNSTFDVVSKVADWYAVKLPDNTIGFVPQNQCKPIVVEDSQKTQPSQVSENTRSNANTNTNNDITENTNNTENANTTENANKLTDDEQNMLKLINSARSENDLPPLKSDMELANVARIKSQDMIDNDYFSHYSPTYGSPFDMMKDFGIDYVEAGENIAGNRSVKNAHEGLMNSPGHRKNILNPNFTHIGLGIKDGGPYGKMFTQMFISKPK